MGEIQVINGSALEERTTNVTKSSTHAGVHDRTAVPDVSAPTRQVVHAFEQGEIPAREPLQTSKARRMATIVALTAMTFTSSMSTGLITIGITQIASDLQLPSNLLLWYVSIFYPNH